MYCTHTCVDESVSAPSVKPVTACVDDDEDEDEDEDDAAAAALPDALAPASVCPFCSVCSVCSAGAVVCCCVMSAANGVRCSRLGLDRRASVFLVFRRFALLLQAAAVASSRVFSASSFCHVWFVSKVKMMS